MERAVGLKGDERGAGGCGAHLEGVGAEDTSGRGDEVPHQHGETRQTQEEEAGRAPPDHSVQHILIGGGREGGTERKKEDRRERKPLSGPFQYTVTSSV